MMERTAAVLATIGHEMRLTILRVLLAHPRGLVASEIQRRLGVPASTLSHHLDVLVRAGLATPRREGRFRRYRATPHVLLTLLDRLTADCRFGPEPPAAESSGPLCD